MSDEAIMQQPQEPEYSKKRVAAMIIAIFTCMILTGLSSYKLLPMQSAIMDFFQIGESQYGVLNTAASWVSVVCAIPMGFLVRKLRCNFSVIIGYLVAIAGIFVQAMSTSFTVFVLGRMLEGAGAGFAGLVTGALILNLVDRKHMSFWSCLMVMATVVPQVIMTKGGTTLMVNSGISFQNLFLIVCGIYGVAILIWIALVPFSVRIHGVASAKKATKEQTRKVYKNKDAWFVAIALIFYNAGSMTFTAYIIKFLTTKGLTQMQAADYYSLTTIIGLVSMIIFGILSDKFKTRRKIAIVSFIAAAVAFVALGLVPGNMIWIYVCLWGTLPRSIAGFTNATSAELAEVPSDIPIVNSVRNTITQIGSIIMGLLMGVLIQYAGYMVTTFIIAGGMLVGAVMWFLAKKII
ncbi:MAG: MFS transporter [Lachnospiraceae bacterium]|nr:MFS transporter [Lachnospiraceae bacterium]